MNMNLTDNKRFSPRELLSAFKSQRGSGLIEVMVSLLILGVGLLGMLSLQANGINGSQRASFVTEAQLIAQDMADRIIATTNVSSSPVANTDIRTGSYGDIDIKKGDAMAYPSCAAGCAPAAAKVYNEDEWLQLVTGSSLSRGRGVVLWTAAAGAVPAFYRVQVMWDQERDGTAVTCTINNCFQMEVRLP
jgi:type IV pilus assembly protein PilV